MVISACSGTSKNGPATGPVDNNTSQTFTLSGTLPVDGPPQYGGTLRVNVTSETPSLDPHASPSFAVPTATAGTVYNKLVEFQSNRDLSYGTMKVVPDLAESYTQSPDGMTWTFNLRHGVKFQDIAPVSGREFQASDVVCTLDRIKSYPGPQLYLLNPVQTYETPDPYTVVFHMNFPYPAFDESLASFYMAMLPCEGTRGEYDLANTAIGTGPFQISSRQRNVETDYVKNPNYFVPGEPYLDGLKVVVIPDANAALAAMRTGELDVTGSINQTLLPALKSTNPEIVVRSQLTLGPNQIMFNMTSKPFDDYRVRKAIAMSIDRDGLAKAFYDQYYMPTGPIPSVLFGGMNPDDAEKAIPYDPEGAKKLLADAGYPNGITAKMLTTSGYGDQFVSQAQWVQQDLAKIGVNVDLNILDYATYFSTFAAKDYDIGWGLSSSFLSADEYLEALYMKDGSRNYFNFSDPTLEDMIKQQRSELDKDKRAADLAKINTYILENSLPLWFGFQFSSLVAQQPWVHNYYASPSYGRVYMATLWMDTSAPTRK
ncbi:MAG: ABC transporter substrate-binding protein [Frankiaceae bacterium]|jgi:ABC-type transport system substrate-binding protein|nr:ABC transporter substrate-binding protein [Frankiaceae bacterium]